jgi:phospholipid/cholesterol/gamma-HCH transport system substrate-binding protein
MKPLQNEIMLGGFIVAAGGLLAYMAIAVGGFNMAHGIHVIAEFDSAAGLVKDATVAIAGVEVGHVESLSVDGNRALVRIFIKSDTNAREDVVAAIRAKSLLGEKFVALVPVSQSAPMLKSGDVITHTRSAVEPDELMAALAPILKRVNPDEVADIIHEVAKTVDEHPGSLGRILAKAEHISGQVDNLLAKNRRNIDSTLANAASLTQQGRDFLKSNRPGVERAIAHVDHLSGVLDGQTPRLTHIAANVDSITSDIKAKAPHLTEQLDKTLSKAPALIDGVSSTLAKTNPLLDKANSMSYRKIKEMAHDIMIKDGVRVYVYPFGPSEADWQKQNK